MGTNRNNQGWRPIDPELARAIGQRVFVRRTAKGWTQWRLARTAGTTASTICRIEGGARNMTVPMAAAICRALKMNPSELFGWDENQTKE